MAEDRKPVIYIAAEKIMLADPDRPRLVEEGKEFAYAGTPSKNMIPTCEEGRRRSMTKAEPQVSQSVEAALAKAKSRQVEAGRQE